MNLEQLLSVTQFGTNISIKTSNMERRFVYDLSINSKSAFVDLLNFTVSYVYIDGNQLVIEI